MDYIDSSVADRFISEANNHVLHKLNHKLENHNLSNSIKGMLEEVKHDEDD